jgi:signal transduction histidine kinase
LRISIATRPGDGQSPVATASSGAVPPLGEDRPGRSVLPKLAILALSTPTLMVALALSEVDSHVILLATGLWAVVQMPLLVALLHDQALPSGPRPGERSAVELVRRAEEAEAAAEREEELLHEVRATVSGIGMTHRLLTEYRAELPAQTRTRLESLYESELSRLQRLVDEDGAAHELVALDVASLLAPLIESLRLRGVDVSWIGSSATVAGRPDEVVEIVGNLLENTARHATGAPVSVTSTSNGDEVRITVRDSGPGIPRRMRAHLFERGTRRHGSTGRGLGLHIARRLARDMGGDVVLHPDSGRRGTAFALVLPACVDGARCVVRAE